jgi:hypothetical protein
LSIIIHKKQSKYNLKQYEGYEIEHIKPFLLLRRNEATSLYAIATLAHSKSFSTCSKYKCQTEIPSTAASRSIKEQTYYLKRQNKAITNISS